MIETKEQTGGLSWEEVCADPNLQDLPYKIETNEWGQIVMTPTHFKHGAYQARIARRLEDHIEGGRAVTEAPVRTSAGTKVPDVVWVTQAHFDEAIDAFETTVAPAVCVEVLSPRNVAAEIEHKMRLYFEAGAEEVWICDLDGTMQFFNADGRMECSERAPDFPAKIEV